MTSNQQPVIVKQSFKASDKEIWNAITDVKLMRQWYFNDIPSFKAEVGFRTEFNVVSGQRNFLHQWQVTEAIPLKKISYDWMYPDYPGEGHVTFELSKEGNDHVMLTLTCIGIQSFPQDIPEFSYESCLAGWRYFINQNLKDFLEKSNS